MQRVEIKPFLVPADALYVADRLRAADRQELEAATGRTACEAVFASWAASEYAWCAHIDGKPGFLFGVAPGGVIWMSGTDAIEQAALGVFRLAKVVVPALLKEYGFLHNIVDIRNHLHIRWLKLVGFKFGPLVDVRGHPFRQFHMKKEATTDV